MHMSRVSQARSHCSGSASGEESRAGAQSTGRAPGPGRGVVPAAVAATQEQLPATSQQPNPPAAPTSFLIKSIHPNIFYARVGANFTGLLPSMSQEVD